MTKQFVLAINVLLLFSCQTELRKSVKSEQLKIFSMVDQDGEYVKGNMIFSESKVFDEKGNMLDHKIRQKDNSLNTEKFIYDNGQLIRSNYYDQNNKLLSYYTYTHENELMALKNSYDASSEELLRIEEFVYNEKHQLTKKIIKTPLGNISRTMTFSYDANSNEHQLTTRDENGNIITNEEYKIFSYDVDKRWLERWSLNNGTPLTFQIRTLDYYK